MRFLIYICTFLGQVLPFLLLAVDDAMIPMQSLASEDRAEGRLLVAILKDESG